MKKGSRILLIAAAIACFVIALSYPVMYGMQQRSNANTMEELAALRNAGMANEDQARTNDEATEAGRPAETRAAPAEAAVPNQEEFSPAGEEIPAEADAQDGAGEVAPPVDADASEVGGEAPAEPAEEQPSDAQQPAEEAEARPEAIARPDGAVEQAVEAAQARPEEIERPDGAVEQAVEAAQAQPEAIGQAPADAANVPNMPSVANVAQEIEAGESAPIASAPAASEAQASAAPRASEAPEGAESAGATEAPDVSATEAPVADEVESEATPEPTPAPTATPTPAPTVDRRERSGVLPYPEKEKVEFDPERILPRYQAIYKLNKDLVGWITIPGTDVNYPVVQSVDSQHYLDHDFFGAENVNGQIILDPLCDPYTPSYNLVISGHNMRTGSMFGELDAYTKKSYWQEYKFVQFDSLMDERQYVIIAAFYSADYDVDEAGFRYNANIQYRMDADQWLADVRDNQLYDTGIDAEFGDEFLTLTTCNRERRKDGRFVLVCRRIREGETFE